MSIEIKEVVALVTGANRGIGQAIAAALARAGARRVYATARQAPDTQLGANVVGLPLDITDDAQIAQVAARCADVTVLINNAGVALGQPLLAAPDLAAAAQEMNVNYFGPLRMARAFAPILARNGGGAIVNVLSILARVSMPRIGSYAASKAAALSMTQGIRAELRAQGTLVVGVLPAFVDTDMAKHVPGPKLSPEALADAVLAALRDGSEDIYPGEAAALTAQQLASDPKAVERRLAAM